MIVYRLAAKQYIDDLAGTGAKLFGGRWNPVGKACIYTSAHISLALLEKFVHANHQENMQRIALLRLELPDNSDLIFHADEKLLKESWPDDVSYSQWIGEQVLSDASVIGFSVPSAIVPTERNYILNPLAKDFNRVKAMAITDFTADFRLLSKLLP
jgi:RES domain-containing protein